MIKNPLNFLTLSLLCILFSGCSSFKETMGITSSVPDEFEVRDHKPLDLSCEESLPKPGSSGNEKIKRLSLSDLLLSPEKKKTPPSKSEKDLLEKLKTQHVQGIKKLVNQEAEAKLSKEKTFKDIAKETVFFWQKNKKKPAKVIDAEKEKKRLEKNELSA